MKESKRKFEFFTFYDKTGIEAHLEKMAEQGWLLESISPLRWTYRRIEPKKIHFSVSYYAAVSGFEPEPTEQQQSFIDFCDYSGWKLAASTVQMQIFYNEKNAPIPIETDPMLEVENIHRFAKKTALRTYSILFVASLLMGTMFISSLLGDPIRLLSSAINMFTGVWFVVAFVYTLAELCSYFFWRRKAKVMAQQGVFLETRGHRGLLIAVFVFMLVSLGLYLISIGNTALQVYMITFMFNMFAVIFLVQAVKEVLKRKKVKAGTNKLITSIMSFTIAFVLMGTMNILVIYGIKNDVFKDSIDGLPFTIGELTGIDDSNYIKTHGDEDSLILGQIESSQHPKDSSDRPSMGYTVTEVKFPFLYDFCVEQLYHQYDSWRGYDSEYEYVETDAAGWGALKAWELYKDGNADNRFLVCYEKYILEISADWEFTDEQMKIIGDKIIN